MYLCQKINKQQTHSYKHSYTYKSCIRLSQIILKICYTQQKYTGHGRNKEIIPPKAYDTCYFSEFI